MLLETGLFNSHPDSHNSRLGLSFYDSYWAMSYATHYARVLIYIVEQEIALLSENS